MTQTRGDPRNPLLAVRADLPSTDWAKTRTNCPARPPGADPNHGVAMRAHTLSQNDSRQPCPSHGDALSGRQPAQERRQSAGEHLDAESRIVGKSAARKDCTIAASGVHKSHHEAPTLGRDTVSEIQIRCRTPPGSFLRGSTAQDLPGSRPRGLSMLVRYFLLGNSRAVCDTVS